MRLKLVKYKPGVNKKIHLLLAAAIWPLVGITLFQRGLNWIVDSGYNWLIPVSFVVGTMKSFLIFDRTAKKGIDRILRFGDNTCIGAVYSVKTWVMVLGMMSLGFVLRSLSISPHILGTFYVAIGWGLFLSSRYAWQSWYRLVTRSPVKENDHDGNEDV